MNRVSASFLVAAFSFMAAAPQIAQGQDTRTLPTWTVKAEGWSAWRQVPFTDESGGYQRPWCHYTKCGYNKSAGTAQLFRVIRGETTGSSSSQRTPFQTELSPYVLNMDTGNVEKIGSEWSTTPQREGSYISAQGSKILVHAPTGYAKDTATERIAAAAEEERQREEAASRQQEQIRQRERDNAARVADELRRFREEEATLAERERIATADRLAREEREERDRQETADPNVTVPDNSTENAGPEELALTDFELMLVKAGMSDPEKAAFESEYAKVLASEDKAAKSVKMKEWRDKALAESRRYVHPSNTYGDTNSEKLWDWFDPVERSYISEWLPKIVGEAEQRVFLGKLSQAQADLDGGDRDKADDFVKKIRALIKTDVGYYAGVPDSQRRVGEHIVDPMEQLERAQRLSERMKRAANAEEAAELAREVVDDGEPDGSVVDTRDSQNITPPSDDAANGQTNTDLSDTADATRDKMNESLGSVVPPLGVDVPQVEDDTPGFWDNHGSRITKSLRGLIYGGLIGGLAGGFLGAIIGAVVGFAAWWLFEAAKAL